jgi:hypothetical protein
VPAGDCQACQQTGSGVARRFRCRADAAGEIGANRDALEHAQPHQGCCCQQPQLGMGGQQRDQEAARTHEDRAKREQRPAAEQVAKGAQHHAAQRPHQKPDCKHAKACKQA